MAEVVGLLRGEHLPQLHLHLGGIFGAVGEAQQTGDPDTVGVGHHHPGHVEHVPQHQVGCLAAHTGQLQELLHGARHLAAVVPQEHLGGQDDVPGLGPEEAGGMYVLLHLGHVRLSQGLQGGEPGKQGGGDFVHPLVGALGRQAHGEQQLIVLLIFQGAQAVGVERFQRVDNAPDFLVGFHRLSHLTGQSLDAPTGRTKLLYHIRKRNSTGFWTFSGNGSILFPPCVKTICFPQPCFQKTVETIRCNFRPVCYNREYHRPDAGLNQRKRSVPIGHRSHGLYHRRRP